MCGYRSCIPPGNAAAPSTPEEAIRNLRSRYAWFVDDGAWEWWANLFTTDARVTYEGMPTLEGRDEILAFARDTIDDLYTYSMHAAQMPRLTIEDDTGTGEWYLVVFYEKPNGSEGWVTGTYTDEYRRVDGEWRFASVANTIHHDSGEDEPHLQ